VAGLAQFGRGAINLGARINQFAGFQQVAAFIALVGARAGVPADVTGAFHISVGQEAVLRSGIPLLLAVQVHVTALFERQEDLVRHFAVILGVGAGEQVIRQPKLLEDIQEAGMEALIDFQGSGFFGVGAHGDGCAMGIRAADHQDVAFAQALVTGKDICRQVRACQVAHMDFGVGIRPGNSN